MHAMYVSTHSFYLFFFWGGGLVVVHPYKSTLLLELNICFVKGMSRCLQTILKALCYVVIKKFNVWHSLKGKKGVYLISQWFGRATS